MVQKAGRNTELEERYTAEEIGEKMLARLTRSVTGGRSSQPPDFRHFQQTDSLSPSPLVSAAPLAFPPRTPAPGCLASHPRAPHPRRRPFPITPRTMAHRLTAYLLP